MRVARYCRIAGLVFSVVALMLPAQEDKRLTIYTAQTTFSVPVTEVQGREYVALMDIVQPLGQASAKVDGDKVKLRFRENESQFQAGKSKAKVRGKNVEMGADALLDNGVLRVPVRGLAATLPGVLNQAVEVREQARRVILGGAATDFSADFQSNPPRLVLHFSRPVNPSISSEPGRVHMVFSKDAVVGGTATQNFGDKLITSASFTERNGAAELTVAGSAPLLASFSDDNRTITIAAAPQSVAQAPKVAPTPSVPLPAPPSVAPVPTKPGEEPAPAPSRPRFLVIIDPAHGGDDRGALLAAGVEEKEITLAFARRLRAALENDGVTSLLLREGDTNISPEQRAISTNTARPAMYVAVHAGNVGRGVRVYTARVEESIAKAGSLLPWDSAQAAFLDKSKELAGNIATELTKRQVEHAEAPAQLRPLNHLTSAAIAVEFLPNRDGIGSLASSKYQQALCAAIADAIAASRRPQEARK